MGNRPNAYLKEIKEEFIKNTDIKIIAKKFSLSRSHIYNLRGRWEEGEL
jgi:transposase